MRKIVFIGAGSLFGARTCNDIMTFPELHESEIVLVDINPEHLEPVAAYARKLVEHYQAPTIISTASNWRDGVLDGADFVVTAFAQGGPAYRGVPYYYEVAVPQRYGIYQNVADTVGIGGVLRTMRTGGELLAIAQEMARRCPDAYLINYVNPMAMLTRIITLACPSVKVFGLCHNVQNGIRTIARWLDVPQKALQFTAAGVNHMDWFLRLEYLDGRDAYPDVRAAIEREEVYQELPVQCELLKHFGYFTTESSAHCAEYLPYFMPREESRASVRLGIVTRKAEADQVSQRWEPDSPLMQQIDGRMPLRIWRSPEYGVHIMYAMATDTVFRMHLNVLNTGLITNLPDGYCVEVPCITDRTGVHPQHVGALPVQLAALCRGMADMQTLASDAFLEKDLRKAYMACLLDPCTAASATPVRIRECFNELLKVEQPWLEEYWGTGLAV